jgi:4-hydroxy-tetrahydrodipicolinate synthase
LRGVRARGVLTWCRRVELPLLRLDAGPQFVHLVKLAQARAGWGNERLRLPRLPLEREQRDRVMSIIDVCMKVRPSIAR